MADAERINLFTAHIRVPRTITLDEVHMDNGGIRWNVRVSDDGRKPFISRWFNDVAPASDFYENFRDQDIRAKED